MNNVSEHGSTILFVIQWGSAYLTMGILTSLAYVRLIAPHLDMRLDEDRGIVAFTIPLWPLTLLALIVIGLCALYGRLVALIVPDSRKDDNDDNDWYWRS